MADTKGHTRGRGTTSGMAGATGATGPPGLPEPSGLPESPEPLGLPEPSEPSGLLEPHEPLGLPEPTEPPKTPGPSGTARGALVSSLAVDILLPLLVYYAARALGAGQAPALLLSGAPPAVRLLVGAVRHRRIDGVDLFLTTLLVIAALVSLIGGGPRVLLFKNAALSLAVGGWALGTAFTRRPLAFQLGQHLHTGSAVRARAGIWRDSAPFRRGLRVLTLLWGAEQLLDGGLSALAAATLPTDTVPLLDRVVSFGLLGLTAGATLVYAHRFRIRHGLPLFGAPAPMTSPNGSPAPKPPHPAAGHVR
ncbi:VC0807 family protein [Streptomyces tricolor]